MSRMTSPIIAVFTGSRPVVGSRCAGAVAYHW